MGPDVYTNGIEDWKAAISTAVVSVTETLALSPMFEILEIRAQLVVDSGIAVVDNKRSEKVLSMAPE